MSDPRVLLLASALQPLDPIASLELLASVTIAGADKYVITAGKFDTLAIAKAFKIEADYPAEPAYLATLAAWTELPNAAAARDGIDLFCLRRILRIDESFDLAILLREGAVTEETWPEILAGLGGAPFATFHVNPAESVMMHGRNVIFNLRHERAAALLDSFWNLHATGAVYGLKSYRPERGLEAALAAVQFIDEIDAGRPGEGAGSFATWLSGSGERMQNAIRWLRGH